MQKLKLNIGCGLIAPLDWVNIDSSLNAALAKCPWLRKMLAVLQIIPLSRAGIPYPKNIYLHDVRRGLPFGDNSAQAIYCSNFLEHLSKQKAQSFIKECYRVLVNGGIIRIIVPDLSAYAKRYIEKITRGNYSGLVDELPAEEFLKGLCIFEDVSLDENIFTQSYKKIYNKNTHKWMYDEYSLAGLLKKYGFFSLQRKQPCESLIKDIDQLENTSGFTDSVCLEALKK